MALTDRDLNAALAVTRFGLGARADEIAQARGDPQGFLRAQIRPEGAELFQSNGESAAQRIARLRTFREAREAQRKQPAAQAADGDDDARDPLKMAQRELRETTAEDFLARFQLAATTPAGFRERWALFWASHFTVSANKLQTALVVGPYEVEAIRPHVFGAFHDLLLSAETHPAMLLYLDQVQSVGPDSRAASFLKRREGAKRTVGLNENLAREIMELHTVGVDGGYDQADVTEFARAMTGLSIGGPREGPQMAGVPIFRDPAHEPGTRTVMGVRYPQQGEAQAEAILADLAAKPQTARFVCTKIARHFVADDPPPELVGRLERSWMESGGRLDQVAETLIASPEAWTPQAAKLKTPYEFLVSSWRAADASPSRIRQVAPALNMLGQKPFGPPSPKGWPDDAATWAAPDALVKRITWAQDFSAATVQGRDPSGLASQALGARLSPAAATAIARAESRPEGFALLLMSPEFQRR
ncbi:DUF1800 family protein [Phenylobacterium sp.]|uniref:DUF1800 domain-containing protein n=1 Tax=Phenylobacterium sp. TaxID=1871053 RepID=UPI0035B07EFA